MGKVIIGMLFIWLWPWQQTPVKVIDASCQTVVPGRKESPVSVQYEVLIRAGRSSDVLAIDRAWVQDKVIPVRLFSWPDKKPEHTFSKGDTLLLRMTFFKTDQGKPEAGPSLLPEKYRGKDLIIGYEIRKRRKYMPVTRIKRLPDNINL